MLPWQVYERAIANIPPAPEKRYWQRYIYLWINYALFEELEAQDMDRTREVYRACLKLIPHKAFTFAKVGSHFHVSITPHHGGPQNMHVQLDTILFQAMAVLWKT